MIVGDADILFRDNLAMAGNLSAAGVDIDLRIYPESPHGFTGHPTPMARAAQDDMTTWLGEHLGAPRNDQSHRADFAQLPDRSVRICRIARGS